MLTSQRKRESAREESLFIERLSIQARPLFCLRLGNICGYSCHPPPPPPHNEFSSLSLRPLFSIGCCSQPSMSNPSKFLPPNRHDASPPNSTVLQGPRLCEQSHSACLVPNYSAYAGFVVPLGCMHTYSLQTTCRLMSNAPPQSGGEDLAPREFPPFLERREREIVSWLDIAVAPRHLRRCLIKKEATWGLIGQLMLGCQLWLMACYAEEMGPSVCTRMPFCLFTENAPCHFIVSHRFG